VGVAAEFYQVEVVQADRAVVVVLITHRAQQAELGILQQ
jgi:hypothetical protein